MDIKVGRKYVTLAKEDYKKLEDGLTVLDSIFAEIEFRYDCCEDVEMTEEMAALFKEIGCIDTTEVLAHVKKHS